MEPRVNYTAVGAFVLLLGAVLLGLGLWLGSDFTTQTYDRYTAFFDESVSGLGSNAPVKYRGVRVGQVAEVGLDPDNPNRVRVVLEVVADTPIRTDTVARLDVQGLTGIAHIELSGGSPEAAPLEPRDNRPPHPVIETVPSFMTRLDQALSRGLEAIDDMANRFDRLMSDSNLASLSATLENLEQISRTLAANRDNLAQTLRNTEQFTSNAARASQQLPDLVAELDKLLDEYSALSGTLNDAGRDVSKFAQSGQVGMDRLAERTLPRVDAVLERIEALSRNLERLSRELSDNPQMLIYGRPAPAPGPGE